MDDGDAGNGGTTKSLRFTHRYPKTHKVNVSRNHYFHIHESLIKIQNIHSSIESQSKVDVMELSDLHHPNCKINRKINSDLGVSVGAESCRRESESSDSILLSPEASKATEAVEFIAEHLRNEDLYIQVRSIFKLPFFHSKSVWPTIHHFLTGSAISNFST